MATGECRNACVVAGAGQVRCRQRTTAISKIRWSLRTLQHDPQIAAYLNMDDRRNAGADSNLTIRRRRGADLVPDLLKSCKAHFVQQGDYISMHGHHFGTD